MNIDIISLMITGVYVSFLEGNILSFARIEAANLLDKIFGKKISRYIQKPLWDCLPCMASVWTIVFTWSIDIKIILAVCGLNALIDVLLNPERNAIAD